MNIDESKLDHYTLQVVQHLLAGKLNSLRNNSKAIKTIIERDHKDALESKVNDKRSLTLEEHINVSCRESQDITNILNNLNQFLIDLAYDNKL